MGVSFTVRNPIDQITVADVSANQSAGSGTLTAASATELTYQAPGSDTAGAAVAIADGETQLVFDGDDTTQYVVVTRDGTDDLDGAATIVVSASKSAATLLAETETAISKTLRAIATREGDASVQRENLDRLRQFRDQLKREAAQDAGTRLTAARVDLSGQM